MRHDALACRLLLARRPGQFAPMHLQTSGFSLCFPLRAQSHMKSVAVVALALLESAQAFQAGAAPMRTVSRAASPAMFKTGDIGARRLQLCHPAHKFSAAARTLCGCSCYP